MAREDVITIHDLAHVQEKLSNDERSTGHVEVRNGRIRVKAIIRTPSYEIFESCERFVPLTGTAMDLHNACNEVISWIDQRSNFYRRAS